MPLPSLTSAHLRRRPLRAQLTRAFALAGLLPFTLLAVWGIAHGRQESARARRALAQAADHMRVETDEHLEHHRLAVQTLARSLEVAGRPADRAVLQQWLAVVHERYPGFTSMIVADSAGEVLAVTPPDLLPPSGANVADRDYFQVLAWGHARPFVSNAFRGRGNRLAPIVAISAPVHDAAGRFNGIVEGSLDIDGLRRIEAEIGAFENAHIIILDRDTTVVFGGGDARFEPLTPLAGTALLEGADGVVRLLQDTLTGGERYAVVHATSPGTGWQVVVMQPYQVATAEFDSYLGSLVVVGALAALLIGIIAPRVAARATRPVERLATALRDFSPVDPPDRLVVPRNAPAEVGDLAESFTAMAQRTRRVITGLVPICAECKQIRNERGEWETVERYVTDRSEAEFTHGLCPDCLERLGFPKPPPSPPDGAPR